MVEEIRSFDGLAMEELEAQTLDLLPEREEMLPINVNVVPQTNVTPQTAVAVSLFDSKSIAANYSNSVNNFGDFGGLSKPFG
jgi:hypothetical protein